MMVMLEKLGIENYSYFISMKALPFEYTAIQILSVC
jgi:hypothetical protein